MYLSILCHMVHNYISVIYEKKYSCYQNSNSYKISEL